MRRPLILIATAFSLGVLAGFVFRLPPSAGLMAMAGALMVAGTLLRQDGMASIALLSGVVCLGVSRAAIQWYPLSPQALAHVMPRDREFVTVIGRIVDDPALITRDDESTQWKCRVEIEAAQRTTNWVTTRGQLIAIWIGETTETPLQYGDRWRMPGMLIRRDEPTGAEWIFRPQTAQARLIGRGKGTWWTDTAYRGREWCARILGRGLENFPRESGLLRAMLLGYRADLPPDVQDLFSRTGTLHIIAISGSHVVVFAGMAAFLLKVFRLSRHRWVFFLAPMLAAYTLATGSSVSAVRASIMAVLFWAAYAIPRMPDGPCALAASALVILALDPSQLYDIGFLLSFSAVAGLMLLYHPIMDGMCRALDPDPLRLQPESFGQRSLRAFGRAVASMIAASTAAWLFTAPLTMAYFNLVSPVALLANLVVIPLSALILFTGCLSLIFGAGLPVLAEIFNHANRWFIDLLIAAADWPDRLPFSHWYVSTPPIWWIVLVYVALSTVLLVPRTWRWRTGAISVGAVAAATLVCFWPTSGARIIGTNASGVMLIRTPWRDVMIDAGLRRDARDISKWLRAHGVDEIDTLFITRGTADAWSGASGIAERIPIRRILLPPGLRNPAIRTLREEIEPRGTKLSPLAAGDGGQIGTWTWEILYPSRSDADDEDGAIVVSMRNEKQRLTIFGAVNGQREQEVLFRLPELQGSVIYAGAVGSSDAFPADWLARVQPASVILNPSSAAKRFVSLRTMTERLAENGVVVIEVIENSDLSLKF